MTCGYKNIQLYKAETMRLFKWLSDYRPTGSDLLQLIIGASMEEAIKDHEFQYRQLFPAQLDTFAKMHVDVKKIVIIVSPNKTFEPDHYIDPLFISKTPEYEWISEGRSYRSERFNMEVHLFCTPFPHADQERNSKYVAHYNDIGLDSMQNEFRVSEIVQTPDDLEFIREFYVLLGEKMNDVGLVACFSYAVFNKGGEFAGIREYMMFSEIKSLFVGHKNRLLCEWVYDVYSDKMFIFGKKRTFGYITGEGLMYESVAGGLSFRSLQI